jgi:hypothetical protein
MIAALYVLHGGVYFGLPNVDPWDLVRDARLYNGPYPVVAHPPCARWGRYWSGGPNPNQTRKLLGDDGGCFAAAIAAVRKWGGVLEHPEATHAWRKFRLNAPPCDGGWIKAGIDDPGWTCCVEQGHYGHLSRKKTWLYVVRCELPSLQWGKSDKKQRMDDGFHSTEERRRLSRRGVTEKLSKRQREATPIPFRDLLISMAESVKE